jgi:serine/threonine protein kinase
MEDIIDATYAKMLNLGEDIRSRDLRHFAIEKWKSGDKRHRKVILDKVRKASKEGKINYHPTTLSVSLEIEAEKEKQMPENAGDTADDSPTAVDKVPAGKSTNHPVRVLGDNHKRTMLGIAVNDLKEGNRIKYSNGIGTLDGYFQNIHTTSLAEIERRYDAGESVQGLKITLEEAPGESRTYEIDRVLGSGAMGMALLCHYKSGGARKPKEEPAPKEEDPIDEYRLTIDPGTDITAEIEIAEEDIKRAAEAQKAAEKKAADKKAQKITSINIPVVLKTIKPSSSREFTENLETLLAGEAEKMAMKGGYTEITKFLGWGTEQDTYTPVIVMEYVEGINLANFTNFFGIDDNTPFNSSSGPWLEMVGFCGMMIARSLNYLHAREIVYENGVLVSHEDELVHRDIKPANILLGKKGTIKVTDMGVSLTPFEAINQSGTISGTFEYLSPAALDGNINQVMDIYSLGVILYEMITGVTPTKPIFNGNYLKFPEIMGVFKKWDRGEFFPADSDIAPPSMIVKGVPEALDKIVMRMLGQEKFELGEHKYDFGKSYTKATEALTDLANFTFGAGGAGLFVTELAPVYLSFIDQMKEKLDLTDILISLIPQAENAPPTVSSTSEIPEYNLPPAIQQKFAARLSAGYDEKTKESIPAVDESGKLRKRTIETTEYARNMLGMNINPVRPHWVTTDVEPYLREMQEQFMMEQYGCDMKQEQWYAKRAPVAEKIIESLEDS